MTTTSVDLNLILSHLKLNDIQQQQQQQDEEQQENLGQLLNRESLLQRLHSMDGLYSLGSSGRRLLGRSLTSPTSNMRMPTTQPQAHLSLDAAAAEDAISEIPEVYRTHRKLDRSVSEPHPNVFSARSALQQQTSVSSSSSSSSSSRYKTELCRPFEESGSCKYGEKCQFAHGRQELRTVARHPKYKTDLCKTYHTTGLCPYGPRCHFIHNDEERYLNVINRVLLQQQMSNSIEKAQLFQKQQDIAAALASQKAVQQQQQQGTARRASQRQVSTDSAGCSDQLLGRLPFLSYPASDPLGSLSDSPSSSITDSPVPSPTSSLFSEDPINGTSATLGAYTNPKHSGAAFGFTPDEVKIFQVMCQRQQQQQEQQQQLGQVGESSSVSQSSLSLLLAKLSQPEILGLIECLVQKSASCSTPSLPTPSTHCNSLPPVSSRIDLTADWPGDLMSREGTCYSWPYSAVEL